MANAQNLFSNVTTLHQNQQNLFSNVTTLHQNHRNGVIFPAVLNPNPNAASPVHLPDAVKANKKWLDSILNESGAILFRGFRNVENAHAFKNVVECFGYDDFDYGTGGVRSKVSERVYTANDSPPELMIGFHHELSYATEFPTKLFFFCEVEPGSGGETCIVLSHLIYDKMKQKHPKFVKQMEEKGLIYSRVIGKEFDPSSPVGPGWRATFKTDDKSEAEERAKKFGTKLEWLEDDFVKVIIGPNPSFKYDEARKRKIWFNSLAIAYGDMKDKLNSDHANEILFGDGEPLPLDMIQDLLKMLDEECVALQWQKGDVLLVDNLAVLHARKPLLAPPRRILTSFCK